MPVLHKIPRPVYYDGPQQNYRKEFPHISKFLYEKTLEERIQEYTPYSGKYYANTVYATSLSSGESRLKKVEELLDMFFPEGRFKFQVHLHREVLRAVMRQILGSDYERLRGKICKEYGWDELKKNLFTIASRRSGKTVGMAAMVAALVIVVPKIEIVVFSVALRTATEFVRLVEEKVLMYSGGRQMIERLGSSQKLVLYGPQGDQRRLRSFPSGGNAKNVSLFFPKRGLDHTHITTHAYIE